MLSFASPREFRNWLKENHSASQGIWLRIWKKASGIPTVTYAEALDEALCFGWIDSQKKPHDGDSWLQRFTPRKPETRARRMQTIIQMLANGETF